jgi:hypothetical protein
MDDNDLSIVGKMAAIPEKGSALQDKTGALSGVKDGKKQIIFKDNILTHWFV